MVETGDIQSGRLILRPLNIERLQTLLAGDRVASARMLGCVIPNDFDFDSMPLQRRLDQLRIDPTEEPWLVRAMIERSSNMLVGHIGFHARPGAEYLDAFAPGGVELGYTIHPPYQRKRFATEAALSLMKWALDQHGQHAFVLSISPENVASTALAHSLGFTTCSSHIDEIDGLEIIFQRRIDAWPADWQERLDRCVERAG